MRKMHRENGKNKKVRAERVLRIGVLTLICIVLGSSLLVANTLSWFMTNLTAPGTSITTGTIYVKFSSYKVDPENPGQLIQYINSDVNGTDSVEMYNGLQREIGVTAQDDGTVDDVYFLIERDDRSVPLDTFISFRVEGVNGGSADQLSEYISGFQFQLENITDKVAAQTAVPSVTVSGFSGSAELTDERLTRLRLLKAYIDSGVPNASDETHSVAHISDTYKANTSNKLATADGKYCIYRLSTFLPVKPSEVVDYDTISFNIAVTLSAGQVGTYENNTHTTYHVASMEDLNGAIAQVDPGDTVVFDNSVVYNGDLIFTVPVTLEVGANTLTVNGNMIFTGSYGGEYVVDTAGGGTVEVKRVGVFGGNFHIDAPLSACRLIGSAMEGHNDISVAGELKVSLTGPRSFVYESTEENNGLIISRARISDSEGALRELLVRNGTRVHIASGTDVGKITADSGTEVISVINHGKVNEMDFSNVNALLDNSPYVTTLKMPQIFVDNFGTVVNPIQLPVGATTFHVTADNTCSGNTRIIREFDAHDNGVTGAEVTVESMDKNVVPSADYSFVTVYYTHFDSNTSPIPETLQTIFEGDGGSFEGYYQKTDTNSDLIVGMRVVTGSDKSLTDADYAYLRTAFPKLVSLDLSSAADDDGVIPAEALSGTAGETLAELQLPGNAQSLQANVVNNTKVEDLVLPLGVTSVEGDALTGVKYVHVLSSDSPVNNLMGTNSGTPRYIFVPNDTDVVDDYRGAYSEHANYIFREATLSYDGNYFYRIESANTMALVVWVGDSTDITAGVFDSMDPVGNSKHYFISAVEDYAFAGKIVSNDVSATFSNKLRTIGDYAFDGCTSLKGVTVQSPLFGKVGYSAFRNCEGLVNVILDAAEGTVLSFSAEPSWSNGESGNSPFAGCINLQTLVLKHVNRIDGNLLKPNGNVNELSELRYLTVEYANAIGQDFLHNIGDDLGSGKLEELVLRHVGTVENYAFMNCTALKTVYLTDCETLSNQVFMGCTSLEIASLPQTKAIGHSLFEGCSSLRVASIPAVTDFTTDGNHLDTFLGCPSLVILDTTVPATESQRDQFVNNEPHGLDSLQVWLVRTVQSNYSGTHFKNPTDFFPGQDNMGDEALLLVHGTAVSSIYGSTNTEKIVSLGEGYGTDMRWANAGDGAERIHVTYSDGRTKYLCDFGLGDYLYSITGEEATVWRCLVEKITGTETLPESIAPAGGTIRINDKAFQYLDAVTNYTPTAGDRPIYVMPESVTYIGKKAFFGNKMFGVEGAGVLNLGVSAFESSEYLRWAKFPSCEHLEYEKVTVSSKTRYICYQFANSPLFSILEIGVIDNAGRPGNMIGTFYDCYELKLLIIHTETATSEVTMNRNWIAAGFRNHIEYVDMDPIPDYKILISETSSINSNNKNYYRDSDWDTDTEIPRIISTGQYMGDCYSFARSIESYSQALVDNLSLEDIGYGNYLCVKTEDEAAMLYTTLFDLTFGGVDVYITPNTTVDNIPITAIASSAYQKVEFIGNTRLKIADNTTFVGEAAFKSGNTTDIQPKSITEVNLNKVVELGPNAFEGVTTISTITAGENLTILGSSAFENSASALQSVTIKSLHQIPSTNAFGPLGPNSSLVVKVYHSIYESYYKNLPGDKWNNVNTKGTNGAHFETIGDNFHGEGADYSYEACEFAGVSGYVINGIEVSDISSNGLCIPSFITVGTETQPVLALGPSCFGDIAESMTSIQTLTLPYYLLSIDARNFADVPLTLHDFAIAAQSGDVPADWSGPRFRVTDGILYNIDSAILLSCPPAKSGELTLGNVSVVSGYAFNHSKANSVVFGGNGTVVFMSNAFYHCYEIDEEGVHGLSAVTLGANASGVFTQKAMSDMMALTRLQLNNVTTVSVIASAGAFEAKDGEFAIYVPSSLKESYEKASVFAPDLTFASISN